MKLSTSLFSRLYQYATVCIVVGSPLFFIPGTGFSPDATYYIAMTFLITVALLSYIITAVLTKTWHSVSKLEFLSYFAFAVALVGSVLFAADQRIALFGDLFNPFSAAALATLPVVVYLVRALPEGIRHTLKYILAILLGASAFIFVTALMFTGSITKITVQAFSGFSSTVSLAAYMGLFVVGCLFFVRKVHLSHKYKLAIITTAILFLAWIVSISAENSIRPNLSSTLFVGKSVMLNDGLFGIGAGNFSRAWQLYRPQSVIASQYFGYDFNQGADTMSTFFVTIGILGLLAFFALVLSALYSTYLSYRQAHPNTHDHFVLAWIVPLSYGMLVVLMAVCGLGLAKARLSEFHPSKKLAFVMVPIAVVLVLNSYMTVQKARAFAVYTKAQKTTVAEDVPPLLSRAASLYAFDGFYRAQVEFGIQANRNLVAGATQDQEELKRKYLENASSSIDAGLKAVETNRNNYQNYVALGRAYELLVPFNKEEGYAPAKKAYEEAVKLYPENPYLYVMLARLEASVGSKEGVRFQLTEALKKKQNFADALYLMSQLEASDSKIDEALSYAVEAVKNAPNDPLVYVQAGLLYYGKKDYQNAVTSLNTALEKDPNNANVAYFLALSLRDGGRPDLAKTIADELLKRNPGNADLQAFMKSLDTTVKK
jgi:tetratricopeptide (TPR) repeat protein